MRLDVPYFEVCEVPAYMTSAMLNAIAPDDWYAQDYRQNVGNMGHTNSIPLHHTALCASGMTCSTPVKSIRKELLFDKFEPFLAPLLGLLREHYSFSQYAAFLARLAPQKHIGLHCDKGSFLDTCHRIHIPLQTNPLVAYSIDHVEYHWPVGKAYEFDNLRVHGVMNRSDEYRIHLVVNLYE